MELLVRGERISAIAFMSMSGVLDCKTVKHSVNGETFYQCMQTAVLPHLMTFNGINPHSVLIMDNCSIYHVDAVVKWSMKLVLWFTFYLPTHQTTAPLRNPFPWLRHFKGNEY